MQLTSNLWVILRPCNYPTANCKPHESWPILNMMLFSNSRPFLLPSPLHTLKQDLFFTPSIYICIYVFVSIIGYGLMAFYFFRGFIFHYCCIYFCFSICLWFDSMAPFKLVPVLCDISFILSTSLISWNNSMFQDHLVPTLFKLKSTISPSSV